MSQLKLSHNMQGNVTSLSAKIMGKVQNSQVDGLVFFKGCGVVAKDYVFLFVSNILALLQRNND